MKKKIISTVLTACMMAGMLTGTGAYSVAADSSVINMDEDPYQVAIQMVVLPGTEVADEAAMEDAINAITLPAINCTVDLQYVWISELQNTTSLAIAGNEKIDLVHVGTVQSLSSLVGSDILYDMNTDDLLQTHGPELVSLFGDLLNSGNVGGKQLAVPARQYCAVKKGFYYNKTLISLVLPFRKKELLMIWKRFFMR